MDTTSLRNEAVEYARKAVEYEDADDSHNAIKFYKRAIQSLNMLCERDENKYNKDTYKKKISEYEDRFAYLEKLIDSKENKKKEKVGGE
jgi:hypothetical protein